MLGDDTFDIVESGNSHEDSHSKEAGLYNDRNPLQSSLAFCTCKHEK